jgi:hypothetical protein
VHPGARCLCHDLHLCKLLFYTSARMLLCTTRSAPWLFYSSSQGLSTLARPSGESSANLNRVRARRRHPGTRVQMFMHPSVPESPDPERSSARGIDFAMPGDRCRFSRLAIDKQGVLGAFPQRLASVLLQMLEQIAPLHAAVMVTGSRMTSCPSSDSWASVRLASSTI